jgi:ABC-2 type transport system permease protein
VARQAGRRAGVPFRRSLFDTVVVKEWRLIARDPHLISQVLLQLVYLAAAAVPDPAQERRRRAGVGAGLACCAASLTGSLAWIIVSAEDAPDLLQSSPAPDARSPGQAGGRRSCRRCCWWRCRCCG